MGVVDVEAASIYATTNRSSQNIVRQRSLAPQAPVGSIGRYHLTIFLSAFLLFQVEPILVKYLLPWFGGTSAVWTTSLLFFQLVLLAGYAYSHIVGTRMRPRNQAWSHLTLVLISVLLMTATALMWRSPITPGANWQPADTDFPVLHLLALLTVCVGLPYFVLSATAPLLQSWFARDYRDVSPYRLYSLSNLGSLLALMSYPFVVEPNLSIRSQALIWAALYAGFATGMVLCAARHITAPQSDEVSESAAANDASQLSPTRTVYALWILLAALASIMLFGTTSQLTQDVAPIPFLWILPLALYLLSFIICFQNEGWYARGIFHPAFGAAIVLGCIVLTNPYSGIVRQIVVYSALLFCLCMVCNGELVRLRPHSKDLTAFYLMVSVGGAVGGIFAAIIAPHIFRGYWEFQLAIAGSAVLLFAVLLRDGDSWVHRRAPLIEVALFGIGLFLPELAGDVRGQTKFIYNAGVTATVALMAIVSLRRRNTGLFRRPGSLVQFALGIALLVLAKVLLITVHAGIRDSLLASRNFYGTLAVLENDASSPQWHNYAMRNGRISHGWQYPEADKRYQPTSYYGPGSGIGLLMREHSRHAAPVSLSRGEQFRVGIVGLGIGTIATYGRAGDYIRYYEINPAVIKAATDPKGYFTFLADSRARIDIIPGDARLSIERELRNGGPQRFDILVIDAFSGDAIPVHLITQEAMAIYLRDVKPDGVIAFHVTNGYLDLKPVLKELAARFGLRAGWVHDVPGSRMCTISDWVLMARNDRILGQAEIAARLRPLDSVREVRLWTDDYSNLFQVLR